MRARPRTPGTLVGRGGLLVSVELAQRGADGLVAPGGPRWRRLRQPVRLVLLPRHLSRPVHCPMNSANRRLVEPIDELRPAAPTAGRAPVHSSSFARVRAFFAARTSCMNSER